MNPSVFYIKKEVRDIYGNTHYKPVATIGVGGIDELERDPDYIHLTLAVCSPKDVFSKKKGRTIALGRLLQTDTKEGSKHITIFKEDFVKLSLEEIVDCLLNSRPSLQWVHDLAAEDCNEIRWEQFTEIANEKFEESLASLV